MFSLESPHEGDDAILISIYNIPFSINKRKSPLIIPNL